VSAVRHLYLHIPFCAYRCGYCDFVTVVGKSHLHRAYVDALLAELELERPLLEPTLDTIYLGGGTPTFADGAQLERLLRGLPAAREVTVEANPETVTSELADLLSRNCVDRVSLGAQSFQLHLLDVLDRRARPDDVTRAFYVLRGAGFDNISLDLIYGIPGQSAADLDRDLDRALDLAPEHLSCYELEAKPGTRFTHAHGRELERQSEAMETYFERIVQRLTTAGYRWYETANFARKDERDLRAMHNLAYWEGRDYLGLGIGAASTVGEQRWQNAPSLRAYLAALAADQRPQRVYEPLPHGVRRRERVMLGLRLDEPLQLNGLTTALDADAVDRLVALGMVTRDVDAATLALTERGRFLGGRVTAELLA
jgi:oxygen-independent coproporphyrinogen III oxidase